MTKFQEKVWESLKKIPKGKVTSYKEVAKFLGKPNAYRAVGTAVGKNPYAPKIPCHRVVKGNREIGNYSGKNGVKGKIKILKSEGVEVENRKIQNFNKVYFSFK